VYKRQDFYKGQMDDLVVWNKVLNQDEIREVFQKNDDYWADNVDLPVKPFSSIVIVLICLLLLLIVFFVVYKQNRKTKPRGEKINPFQQKSLEIIHQNLSDSDFSVKEFAQALLMSKTKLYHEVKSSVGKSPKEYIREIRIIEAARLLSESDMPVTDIVYKTGFESRAYFNKCFKAQYQVTPTQYRKIKSSSAR
jgi:AraC-like DNA-binding protein